MTSLDERYPRRGRASRLLVVGAVALLAVTGLVWLGWTAWYRSHPAVVARVAAFHVDSDNRTRARVTVDRADAATPVRCFVFAQAKSFERVAEKWVEVPPGARLTDVDVDLRTFTRATSVSVDRCEPTR